jgi:hypothetical protein
LAVAAVVVFTLVLIVGLLFAACVVAGFVEDV